MADYTLTHGKGTAVREDAGAQEGYVDLDIHGLTIETSPADSDHLVLQRGSSDPRKVTVEKLLENAGGGGLGYDLLWVPAAAMVPATTDGAEADTIETAASKQNHDIMKFKGADNDTHAEFDVVMPPAWDRGTVKVKVLWTPGAGASPGSWAKFMLAALALSDDDALDQALGSAVDIEDQVVADGDLHASGPSAALTVGGTPALEDMVHFRLTRDFDGVGSGGVTAVTAKSVVFDVHTNWGNASYACINLIDFKKDGVSLGLTPSDYTVYASTAFGGTRGWENAFDTSQPKFGSADYEGWTAVQNEEQFRVVVVFNTPQQFDEIEVNNGNNAGNNADIAFRSVKTTYSGDEITDTTYNAAVTNGTQLNEAEWPQRSGDVADEQTVWVYAPTGTAMPKDAQVLGVLIQYRKTENVAAW